MIRLKNGIRHAGLMALLLPILSVSAYAQSSSDILTVYAGPQSVAPLEIIHVTIEVAEESHDNLSNQIVVLTYIADGSVKKLSERTILGLVSFEVPAQRQAGLMKFTARLMDRVSNEAHIVVAAGRAQEFELDVERGDEEFSVNMSSDVIADKFGNKVSDLTFVSLDWIDTDGLKKKQSTQLLNGRVVVTSKCPSSFVAPLKIRAAVNSMQSTSRDVSEFCVKRKI